MFESKYIKVSIYGIVMTIHVRYLSQVIIRIKFEGTNKDKMEDELSRVLDEQIQNAKKPLFYLIDISSYEPKIAEEYANIIADKLAEKGDIIQRIAFYFTKKKKIKNKEVKDKLKIYDNDFQAQSWLSDESRFGFLDEITVQKLVDR